MLTITIENGGEAGMSDELVGGPSEGELEVVKIITTGLVPAAAADLEKTQDRSGLSETDIVNRALTLYEFIDAELSSGAELYLRRDGRRYIVKLLSTIRQMAPKAGHRRIAPT
jgi:hypothetical protein